MKRILTIIGARPQIIKAAAISRAIGNHFKDELQEDLLHTGQHYDTNMSEVFFDELGIPRPKYNLNVGSGSHGAQTASMIAGIENILLQEKYDAVLVYGDTNSTIAGALAASKIHIPVIHVEAGLRSFSKAMPEELNRIGCDHMSTLLFSPTKTGITNLASEGIHHHETPWSMDHPGVFECGDIMFDNSMFFAKEAQAKSEILAHLGLTERSFGLCTIHRDTNTDQEEKLLGIIRALDTIATDKEVAILLPLHPRTKGKLTEQMNQIISNNERLIITEPLSFLDMVRAESACAFVVTDSGGVQKEAFFFQKPCIILREQTEWVEIVENGNAVLTGSDSDKIVQSLHTLLQSENQMTWPTIFGDGKAAEFICSTISDFLKA
ncbi:MAG: UDP-N-acetylglucosamine 2-epimerase (non-hydrolyzing) [Flavobacteriales bacterium]